MGFKPRAPPAEVGEYDADCIDYMVANDADVAAAACGEGDWVWLRGDKVRVRPVKAGKRGRDKRVWWEIEAMAALHAEHDAATGGDGLRQMSMLMPNEGEHFYMLAMLPRLEASGVEGGVEGTSGGGGKGGDGDGDASGEGGARGADDGGRRRKHGHKMTRAAQRAMARQAARGNGAGASSGDGGGEAAR